MVVVKITKSILPVNWQILINYLLCTQLCALSLATNKVLGGGYRLSPRAWNLSEWRYMANSMALLHGTCHMSHVSMAHVTHRGWGRRRQNEWLEGGEKEKESTGVGSGQVGGKEKQRPEEGKCKKCLLATQEAAG